MKSMYNIYKTIFIITSNVQNWLALLPNSSVAKNMCWLLSHVNFEIYSKTFCEMIRLCQRRCLFMSAYVKALPYYFVFSGEPLPPSALHESSSRRRSGPHPRSLRHASPTALFDNGKLLTSVISPCPPRSHCS
uniref:(California timema) hypothetical protein n=1 Tax=Timema californicum TaxID=61474 RepID=A0A7R9IZ84_TIMCA|nr:unnamed protein product [Timema californicum]